MLFNINDLKKITNEETKKKFYIKRILLFFILYIALNHKITIFLNSGNYNDLSYVLALELFSVLIISVIYSTIDYNFLKSIIHFKKTENTIINNFFLFLLIACILFSFNLDFYPRFQNLNTSYTNSMIITFSIAFNIFRYKKIQKMLSE